MAPPKRKTTGRVTPKGTRPGESRSPVSGATPGAMAAGSTTSGRNVSPSTRYTPPVPREELESPRWVPILMAVLIGAGGLTIVLRYLVWQDTNLPVLVGLVLLLGGLYTATKWR